MVFSAAQALFDYVACEMRCEARCTSLFGHSAGAQFVHRLVEFTPQHRARVAVAANAGWYTMPDDSVHFPYGLKGSPLSEAEMGDALSSNLIVLIGADDINSSAINLRRNEQADEQGLNRLDRGIAFYRQARKSSGKALAALPVATPSGARYPALTHRHGESRRSVNFEETSLAC